ncbi:MAG: YicC/YloC family endoribonuclease [Thermoanaerobaculia bacterium]
MIGMTGFGEATREQGGVQIAVRLYGVNSRQLDLQFRLPDALRHLEAGLRARLVAEMRRGRCEVGVTLRVSDDAGAPRVEVREEVVTAFLEAARPLVEAGRVRGDLDLGDLLRNSAMVRWDRSVAGETEAIDDALVLDAFEEALAEFVHGRRAEGAATRAALGALFATLGERAERLLAIAPTAQQRLADGLRQRLPSLAEELDRDESRWLQELAVLAEKADIREELDRFSAHLRTLGDGLDSDQAAGRRLDFVCQELLRELNTTSAKCRDVELVEVALDARLLCEQIREQLLNVE